MRRAGGNFEIIIKAPTLGLTTRIPAEQPEVRAAVVASNVRFERGVAVNAPGYGKLTTTPDLDSLPHLIYQTNILRDSSERPLTTPVVGTNQKLWAISRLPAGGEPDLLIADEAGVTQVTAVAFGDVIGFEEVVLQLINIGGSDLIMSSVSIVGDAQITLQVPPAVLTLNPGQSTPITIRITPVEGTASYSANLVVVSNDADSPATVPITAAGIMVTGDSWEGPFTIYGVTEYA